MKSLRHMGGIFAVSKPPGLTSAETCNRIRNDLLRVDAVVGCADHLLYQLPNTPWNGAGYLEHEKLIVAECVSSLEAGFKGKFIQSALKIGHGGTLDSYATGVLPIGLGPGCQLLSKLLHSDKRYTCQVVLGLETDTGAANGNTVRQMGYDHVDYSLVTSTVKTFVGQIFQVPPIYSALKCDGRRLSDYARAGEPIPEKKLVGRPIVVHNITCTDFNPPYFTLDIECGSGCYVRSLVRDVGAAMKTCASVGSLERTMHGFFTLDMCIPAYAWTVERVRRSLLCSQIIMERQMLPNRQSDC